MLGKDKGSSTAETRNNRKLKEKQVHVFVDKHPSTSNAEAITMALETLNKQYWWVYGEDWKAKPK